MAINERGYEGPPVFIQNEMRIREKRLRYVIFSKILVEKFAAGSKLAFCGWSLYVGRERIQKSGWGRGKSGICGGGGG